MKGTLYLLACGVLGVCLLSFVVVPVVNTLAPVAKCQKIGK